MGDRRIEVVNRRAVVTVAGASLIAPLVATQVQAQTGPDRDAVAADRAAIEAIMNQAGEVQSAASVTFASEDPDALIRSVQALLRELPVSVITHGAVADMDRESGTGTDNTVAFRNAIAAAIEHRGGRLHIPAGRYKITDTLEINDKIILTTDGPGLTELVMVSASVKTMIRVSCGDNDSIIGLDLKGLRYVCDGFGHGVNCDAIDLFGTAVNSAFHGCYVQNNEIANCRNGISIDAVFYRNVIQNNTISTFFGGQVTGHGIYTDSAHDVTYNAFLFNEVTAVGDGAWAYYVRSNFSTAIGNTCDGFSYWSMPGGDLTQTVETITTSVPPTWPAALADAIGADKPAVILNQVSRAYVKLVGVTNAKANVGIFVSGRSVLDMPTCIAPQPDYLLKLASGSGGVVNSAYMLDAVGKVEDKTSPAVMAEWVFNSCDHITARTSAPRAWPVAPGFTGWQTAPTVNSATYVVNGSKATCFINGQDGKITVNGALIDNLPIVPAGVGIATIHANANAEKTAVGSIFPANASILGLPIIDLTGLYWQLVVEFLV